jgi:hypothetical protein
MLVGRIPYHSIGSVVRVQRAPTTRRARPGTGKVNIAIGKQGCMATHTERHVTVLTFEPSHRKDLLTARAYNGPLV